MIGRGVQMAVKKNTGWVILLAVTVSSISWTASTSRAYRRWR